MQVAIRTAVYDPESGLPMGRVVLLAEADPENPIALVIESRLIESNVLDFPDLQGATIDLSAPDGEAPTILINDQVFARLNGEAAHYHKEDAARHYVELCKESGAQPPER